MRKGVRPAEINAYVGGLGISWFDAQFMKLVFRYVLIPRAYTADQFKAMATNSKFGMCEISEASLGLEIFLKK